LKFRDISVEFTDLDGSYLDFTDRVRAVCIHTFRGLDAGTMKITVENAETGAFVTSKTIDLNSSGWSSFGVSLTFPLQVVKIRVEAELDPGERLYFDGVTFFPS